MKLKCEAHGRRVHVMENETVIHRNDGTHCNSDVVMGDRFYTPQEVLDITPMGPGLATLNNFTSREYREWIGGEFEHLRDW